MNTEQIKALFPLKAMVTQEIIDSAKLMNPLKCIGALTLKSVFPEELKELVSWGVTDTGDTLKNWGLIVTTEEGFDFMEIKNPCEVTFIVK